MSDDLTLRFKYLCGQYWYVLIPALLVVSMVAFASAATGVASETAPSQVAVETDAMTVETTLSTEAVVTGNTTLYEPNATLADMPVYLRSATPELRVIAVTTTPTDRPVDVTQQLVVALSASRNGAVFWRDSQTLAVDTRTVTDGVIRTEAALDIERLTRQRFADVTREAGDIATISVRLEAVGVYETDTYSGRTTASTPLRITDRTYELETPQTDRRTNTTTVQQVVGEGPDGSGLLGPGTRLSPRDVGAGLGSVIAFGLALGVWRTRIGIGDFDAFRRHYERTRYVEWISRGSIPATGKYARVPVETLLDLVDIGIDSDKRVIHDPAKEIYAVVDGNLMYEFRDGDDGNTDEFGFASFDEPTTPLADPLDGDPEPRGPDSETGAETGW